MSAPPRHSTTSHPNGARAVPVAATRTKAPANRLRIALLVKNFQYGGTQRVLLRLANKLSDYGHEVEVLAAGDGPLKATLRDGVRFVRLRRGNVVVARVLAARANPAQWAAIAKPLVLPLHPVKGLRVLESLASHLRVARPDVLISATASHNVAATLAKRLAGVPTRLVLTEHATNDQRRLDDRRWARRYLPELMRRTYPDADAIVGVSSGVVEDLRQLLQVPRDRVRRIYNPAVPDDVDALAAAPVEHPWFAPNQPPVVLSAGRAGRTKDFPTLVRAFARLRNDMHARLVILSSGVPGSVQDRDLRALSALAEQLGVADDFRLLDFTDNPFAYMARAGVFASSSTSEGFGNVVAEALACGCPVVSTQTRGPAEVLDAGRYGRLVAAGDEVAMADALAEALRAPRDSAVLQRRAALFGEERAARAYEALCDEVVTRAQAVGV